MKYNFLIKPFVFVCGLGGASLLVLWIEALRPSDFGFYKDIFKKEIVIERSEIYPLRKSSELTEEEMKFARIAWKYFENNYQPETGFVNSVDLYPSATFWDLSSYLLGMLSAHELGIVDSAVLDARLKKCFESLGRIRLYKDILPNKVYNTQNLIMTDYGNRPSEEGVGWSAMDIGRFFSFVNKIRLDYNQYYPALKKIISRWKIEEMIVDGTLHSISFSTKDRAPHVVQEGKLGYEEYCAKGLMLSGYDVSEAMVYTDFIRFKKIYGVEIGIDTREVKYNPAYNYVLSEPYVLDGIEYGWDVNSRELAYRIFKAQKEKWAHEKILTCVSEDHLDQPPYFVYNSVYADGEPWNCISESGEDASDFKTFSVKTAFGWYALFEDEYSQLLFESVKDLYDPEKGWYAGRYEKNGKPNKAITANTNGVILEALNYKRNGKISGSRFLF